MKNQNREIIKIYLKFLIKMKINIKIIEKIKHPKKIYKNNNLY